MPLTLQESTIVIVVIAFTMGFLLGYVISTWQTAQDRTDMQKAIAFMISITWVASLAAGVFIPEYSTSLAVHGIMGAAAGYLFQGDGGFTVNLGAK